MKIIILAAGRGERLMPLTQNTPKPLIDMNNGNTLLEEQIKSIQESGCVHETILVTGYLADQIDAKIKTYNKQKIQISTIYNPFWNVSNNLMSLWLARNIIIDNDTMITNGDNIFSPEVFSGLAKQDNGIYVSACRRQNYDDDDMRISLKEYEIKLVSKKISNLETHAESPGLVMIKGERARNHFYSQLEKMARDSRFINAYWLEIFGQLWNAGTPATAWFFSANGNWQEVDFHIDVHEIRKLIDSKLEGLTIRESI